MMIASITEWYLYLLPNNNYIYCRIKIGFIIKLKLHLLLKKDFLLNYDYICYGTTLTFPIKLWLRIL